METPNPKFRVLIVGGSVTGLTLAHCLAKNGIEFTLLEAGKEIAPQVGPSIGLFPNGGRILDQLGIFDDIMQQVEPLKKASLWSDDKKLILQSDSPQVLHERHGYPIAFLERRCLLEILYKHLGHQQDEVLTNKRVINIEHYSTHVVAHCADDTSYEGDIVVGADGIRSTVRKSMWTYMENHGLQSQVQKERAIMSAEYSCVFGISKFTPGLKPGESHRTFAEGYSFLTIVGKDKVYWFFFRCMNCKFYGDEIPRLDQNNIDEHVGPYLEKPITDSVPFGEVYNRAITRTHLALEEAEYQHYCIDRWVCIGDSIHKMTPNLGQGGNSAIESAAALANSIAKLIQSTSQFQTEDIHRSFKGWEATRQQRVVGIWKSAHDLTRLEAIQSLKDRLKIYLIPYMSTQMIDRSSKAIIGAERLDCVALPPRSLQCSMPYKSDNKTCQPTFDSLWTRALLCAQFVGCIAVARGTMRPTIAQVRPLLVPYLKQGTWTARNGEVVDLTLSIYHVPFLDNLFRPLIACFLPSISGSDMQSRTQMLCFITDLGSVYGMWLLESYRKGGSWPGVLLAIGMGTAFQLKGVGYFAPVFYMLDYLRLPLEHLLHDNKSEIAPATSISLLLATLVGHHLPNFACFLVPSLKDRRWWNAVWQLFPVTIPLIQVFMLYPRRLHAKAEREAAKEKKDKTSMQSIRFTYGSFALISALTFIYARHSAPAEASLASIFWPGVSGHLLPVTSFEGGIARFLRYDHIISTGSGFVWLVLRFRELKNLGANISWWKAIGAFIGTTWALGPGTAFALGWGWKEELLNEFTTPNK